MASYVANISALEANLAVGMRTRDDNAFQELFRHFGQKIFRTAMKILREEESAKDALQETMINIHRAANTFRGEARLTTWINRITVNVCLEMIRKNRKHNNRTPEDVSEHISLEDVTTRDPYTEARRSEVRRRVHRALARLGEKRRVVVHMHDLEGFTIREIAEQLAVAVGTIKSRLFYGRKELRKELAA